MVSIVGYLARNVIIERLRGAISHEYAVQLERIRAGLAAENTKALEEVRAQAAIQHATWSAAFAAMTAAHMAGHERTLAAIETLWQEMRRIKRWLPLYAGRLDILVPSEFPDALDTDPIVRSLLSKVDEHQQVIDLAGDDVVEMVRPFIGEYLYAVFFAYRAFTGRVARLILNTYRRDKLESWHDDAGIKAILRSVLTEQEFREVPLVRPGRIEAVHQVLERKMLEHIAKVLSGEASATFNLRQAREIIAVASSSEARGA